MHELCVEPQLGVLRSRSVDLYIGKDATDTTTTTVNKGMIMSSIKISFILLQNLID